MVNATRPLEKRDRGSGTTLVEPVGQEFGVRSRLGVHGNAKRVELRIVLIGAPADLVREDPGPRAGLFKLEEQRVGAGAQILAADLHVVRDGDRRAFVGASPPRRRMRRPEALVEKAELEQLAPDVVGAVAATGAAVHVRTVIGNRDLHRSDPLRHVGLLIEAVRRHRQLGQFLTDRGPGMHHCREQRDGQCSRNLVRSHESPHNLLSAGN